METRNIESILVAFFKSISLINLLIFVFFCSLITFGLSNNFHSHQKEISPKGITSFSAEIIANSQNKKTSNKVDFIADINNIEENILKIAIKYLLPFRLLYFQSIDSNTINNPTTFLPFIDSFNERIYIKFCALKIPF